MRLAGGCGGVTVEPGDGVFKGVSFKWSSDKVTVVSRYGDY